MLSASLLAAGATNVALNNGLFTFGSSGRHRDIDRPSERIDKVVGKGVTCAVGRQTVGVLVLS